MNEELEVLKQHAETLNLLDKETFTLDDKANLVEALRESDENALANHVKALPFLSDFRSLIETLKD
jgi:hypothetical protein